MNRTCDACGEDIDGHGYRVRSPGGLPLRACSRDCRELLREQTELASEPMTNHDVYRNDRVEMGGGLY
jgi:hypothetical protein